MADLQLYFWTAFTQQGIYRYETAPFQKYLQTNSIYKFDWAFPDGITKDYDVKAMQNIKTYLDDSVEKILFIYGEYDTWSATAVELSPSAKNRGLYKFIKPKGDHRTRIKSFSLIQQQSIYTIIDGWIIN